MAGIVTGIIAGVAALGSLGVGIAQNSKANKNSKIEAAKARREEARLRALEASRQPVVDKSDEIRAMKDEVFNPYQNLGVAMQGVNLKIEQTDEALANTLNSLNRSGAGAGAATALARQAAASKAQVAASIENQELKNQQLYFSGEQQKLGQQLALEQQAIQEEINVYGRQETRDIAQLNRLQAQQQNAEQRAIDFQAAGQAALMAGVSGAISSAGVAAGGFNQAAGGAVSGAGTSGYNPYTFASGSTDPATLGSGSKLLG